MKPSRGLLLSCAALLVGCGEATLPTPTLELSATELTAGDTVTATWDAPEASTVVLTDSEGRALLVDGPARGAVDVFVVQSTTLRLIAQHADADVVAEAALVATPKLAAQVEMGLRAAGRAAFTLTWDALGAGEVELTLDGARVAGFDGRSPYEGLAEQAQGGAVELVLEARDGPRAARFTQTVRVPAAEVDPNDTIAQARAAPFGVVGTGAPGDVDLFAVEVAAGGHVQANLRDPAGGCALRGLLRLRNAAGDLVAGDTATLDCARLGPGLPGNRNLAAGTYYVEVELLTAGAYWLEASAQAPACGNGLVEGRAGEHCEPEQHPMLCNADCTADVVAEVEPNDLNRDAQPIALGARVLGRVDTPGAQDDDVYAVELEAPARLSIEVTGPNLTGCDYLLGGITLRRGDGIQLERVELDQLGVFCGRLTGHEQGVLPAGRYLVMVDLADFLGPDDPRYFLKVDAVADPECGDGRVEADEACDDGNLLAGDGCDAACDWEVAERLTPRRAPYVITGGPLEDGQAMRLALDMDGPARLSVVSYVPTEGLCEGPDHDVVMVLDDALVRDDSGLSRCAFLDTYLEVESPPEQHDLLVRPAPGTRLSAFTIVARFDTPTTECGDRSVEADEVCDDGNLEDGDGCSSACALEPRAEVATVPGVVDGAPLTFWGQVLSHPLDVPEPDTLVTFTPIAGPDGFCPEDFTMELYDETFDFVGGMPLNRGGTCRVGRTRAGAGRHYFAVRNRAPFPIEAFSIDLAFEAPTCGDGVFTPARGEACDDGNRAVGDGCDASCALEPGRLSEVEPNDTPATASALLTRTASVGEETVLLAGHLRGEDQLDHFVIDNQSGAPMWLDVFGELDMECGNRFDLRLYDAQGTLLAEDVVGGVLSCQRLSPTNDPGLGALDPGRYTLEVGFRGRLDRTYYLRARAGSGVFP